MAIARHRFLTAFDKQGVPHANAEHERMVMISQSLLTLAKAGIVVVAPTTEAFRLESTLAGAGVAWPTSGSCVPVYFETTTNASASLGSASGASGDAEVTRAVVRASDVARALVRALAITAACLRRSCSPVMTMPPVAGTGGEKHLHSFALLSPSASSSAANSIIRTVSSGISHHDGISRPMDHRSEHSRSQPLASTAWGAARSGMGGSSPAGATQTAQSDPRYVYAAWQMLPPSFRSALDTLSREAAVPTPADGSGSGSGSVASSARTAHAAARADVWGGFAVPEGSISAMSAPSARHHMSLARPDSLSPESDDVATMAAASGAGNGAASSESSPSGVVTMLRRLAEDDGESLGLDAGELLLFTASEVLRAAASRSEEAEAGGDGGGITATSTSGVVDAAGGGVAAAAGTGDVLLVGRHRTTSTGSTAPAEMGRVGGVGSAGPLRAAADELFDRLRSASGRRFSSWTAVLEHIATVLATLTRQLGSDTSSIDGAGGTDDTDDTARAQASSNSVSGASGLESTCSDSVATNTAGKGCAKGDSDTPGPMGTPESQTSPSVRQQAARPLSDLDAAMTSPRLIATGLDSVAFLNRKSTIALGVLLRRRAGPDAQNASAADSLIPLGVAVPGSTGWTALSVGPGDTWATVARQALVKCGAGFLKSCLANTAAARKEQGSEGAAREKSQAAPLSGSLPVMSAVPRPPRLASTETHRSRQPGHHAIRRSFGDGARPAAGHLQGKALPDSLTVCLPPPCESPQAAWRLPAFPVQHHSDDWEAFRVRDHVGGQTELPLRAELAAVVDSAWAESKEHGAAARDPPTAELPKPASAPLVAQRTRCVRLSRLQGSQHARAGLYVPVTAVLCIDISAYPPLPGELRHAPAPPAEVTPPVHVSTGEARQQTQPHLSPRHGLEALELGRGLPRPEGALGTGPLATSAGPPRGFAAPPRHEYHRGGARHQGFDPASPAFDYSAAMSGAHPSNGGHAASSLTTTGQLVWGQPGGSLPPPASPAASPGLHASSASYAATASGGPGIAGSLVPLRTDSGVSVPGIATLAARGLPLGSDVPLHGTGSAEHAHAAKATAASALGGGHGLVPVAVPSHTAGGVRYPGAAYHTVMPLGSARLADHGSPHVPFAPPGAVMGGYAGEGGSAGGGYGGVGPEGPVLLTRSECQRLDVRQLAGHVMSICGHIPGAVDTSALRDALRELQDRTHTRVSDELAKFRDHSYAEVATAALRASVGADPLALTYALQTVTNLGMQEAMRAQLGALGCIELAAACMRPEAAQQQRAIKDAIVALRHLAYENDDNKIRIIESGAMSMVVVAMAAHRDSTQVQKQACNALKIFSVHTRRGDDVKRAVLAAGGVEALLETLFTCRGDPFVAIAAVNAIATVCHLREARARATEMHAAALVQDILVMAHHGGERKLYDACRQCLVRLQAGADGNAVGTAEHDSHVAAGHAHLPGAHHHHHHHHGRPPPAHYAAPAVHHHLAPPHHPHHHPGAPPHRPPGPMGHHHPNGL